MKSNRILICFLVLTIVLSTISPILAFAEDDGETMITITRAEDLFNFSEKSIVTPILYSLLGTCIPHFKDQLQQTHWRVLKMDIVSL